MAYYSGIAATLADLRTALLTHAVADGWVLTGDVLSKAGVYFQIQVNATHITCLGCEDDAVANPAPAVVMMGKTYERSGQPTRQISFPCNYEVFGFAQELYLIVNYDVDSYQWMAFGKSTVPGLPGQAGWCGAPIGSAIQSYYSGSGESGPVHINLMLTGFIAGSYAGSPYGIVGGGPYTLDTNERNVWVNSNLDAHGWKYGASVGDFSHGISTMSKLMWTQPSAWNSESVLLPLRLFKTRPSYKSSLILDCEHARHVRIDNFNPGDVLTLGSDKWKVFPWYRKNTAERNATNTSHNHSGTLGWAIRYEGP